MTSFDIVIFCGIKFWLSLLLLILLLLLLDLKDEDVGLDGLDGPRTTNGTLTSCSYK